MYISQFIAECRDRIVKTRDRLIAILSPYKTDMTANATTLLSQADAHGYISNVRAPWACEPIHTAIQCNCFIVISCDGENNLERCQVIMSLIRLNGRMECASDKSRASIQRSR